MNYIKSLKFISLDKKLPYFNGLKRFGNILAASFKIIYRDKQAIYFSLFMPVVIILIIGTVLGNVKWAGGLSYGDFVIPGLVAMTVMQMAIFSTAFVLSQYRDKGILKKVLTTPLRPVVFLSAQIGARLTIAAVQVILFFSVAILALSFTVYGSFLTLILIGVLGALVFLTLGFVIAGIAKTSESVPAIANIVVFPMLFLGDVFFPIESLPVWLEKIAKFLPIQYLAHGLREVALNGSSLWTIAGDLLGLIIWLIIFLLMAQKVFSLNESK